MNKNQIKRLYLVLLLPLLLLGWWMAEEEILFEKNHVVSCVEENGAFRCISYRKKLEEKRKDLLKYGGVYLYYGARLEDGFDETVADLKTGVVKRLEISPAVGAAERWTDGEYGPCSLEYSVDANGGATDVWSMTCGGHGGSPFRFVDRKVNEKYHTLVDLVKIEKLKFADLPIKVYIGSILFPPVLLLFALGLIYLLTKIALFIRYGGKKT